MESSHRPESVEVRDSVEGTIDRILFSSPDGGFVAARVKTSGGTVVVRGALAGAAKGMLLRAAGGWKKHPKYGEQFIAESWEWVAPRTAEGVERFLVESGISGLGEKTARRIVAVLGVEVLSRIDRDPGCLKEVKGLKKTVRERIVSVWREKQAGREALTFLYGLGLGPGVAGRIYKAFGSAAPALVREDPYRLCRAVTGVGFVTADHIARNLGVSADAPARIREGCLHVLEEAAARGHCYLPAGRLKMSAGRLLAAAPDTLEGAVASLQADPRVMIEKPSGLGKDAAVYLRDLWRAESELAEDLAARVQGPCSAAFSPIVRDLEGLVLTDEQRDAVRTALSWRISVITGGPGVGKTAVIRALAGIARRRGVRCLLAAPTGRAAKRIEELTGRRASTIHLMLRYDPYAGAFQYDRVHKLQTGLVVVDEASMVDLPLAWRLVQAVPEEVPLVFVGDVDQLPSVGPGSVLADLVASGRVKVARLTRIFRQGAGSAIVENAHRVNCGEMPDLTPQTGAQFVFLDRPDALAACLTAVQLAAEEIPKRLGLDPWSEIQVLAPLQKGEAGVVAANHALQARLNPGEGGIPCGEYRLRPGDKVMQTQNDYGKGVFNGDVGRLVSLDSASGEAVVRFGARPVVYAPDETRQLTLAYASTVHKAQGSEIPAVVILIVDAHRVMLARNLLYTAITRGKRLVVLVGSRSAVAAAVRNARGQERFSALAQRLRNAP